MNIIFAGTPEFASTILQGLLNSNHKIQAVLCQPDKKSGRGQKIQISPVKKLAAHFKLPILQPLNLKDEATINELKKLQPDLIVVAAYGLILPKIVLDLPKFGCINVHASLLPHWRGASPINQAILAGDALSGITIMQMDQGLDTGDILSLYPCTLELNENAETLSRRLANLGSIALLETLDILAQGNIVPQKQNDADASYAPKIKKQDGKINWHKSASEIERQIRAYYIWPVAFSAINNELVRIYSATPITNEKSNEKTTENTAIPGTILQTGKTGIDVMTKNGILRILELQLPGGKRQPVVNILQAKNHPFIVGSKFSD